MSKIEMILQKTLNAKSNNKFAVLEGLIKKHYTPITNRNRLNNGEWPFQAVLRDLNATYNRWSPPPAELLPYVDYIIDNINSWDDKIGAFFVTRQDISPEQQLVQTSHCASVLGQSTRYEMGHCNFICLSVADGTELAARFKQLPDRHCGAMFYEPDNNMGLSSFCTLPIRYSIARRMGALKGLNLLKFS